MGCAHSAPAQQPAPLQSKSIARKRAEAKHLQHLVNTTHFTTDEIRALDSHFQKLSNSLHHDGVIHLDEFALSLFKTGGQSNMLVERLFQGFDLKQNDVVDFDEFVGVLSIFHPSAPLEEKAAFAFKIYDLDQTGYIEPGEVKRLMAALLHDNPAIALSDAEISSIVDQTILEADVAGDGHISPSEWQALVQQSPDIINYMTLPVLKQVTTKYPSFLFDDIE